MEHVSRVWGPAEHQGGVEGHVRRRRLVRVGPTMMIYWLGEGLEEFEGTLDLRTIDALRDAGGVGYWSRQ